MTPEELQMLQDLGSGRRDELATMDIVPKHGGPPKTRRQQGSAARHEKTVGTSAEEELGSCKKDDGNRAGPGAGQMYRLRAMPTSYGHDTGRSDERMDYLHSRKAHTAGNYIASPRPQKVNNHNNSAARPRSMPFNGSVPVASRQRAPSPRASGVTKFIKGQRVEKLQAGKHTAAPNPLPAPNHKTPAATNNGPAISASQATAKNVVHSAAHLSPSGFKDYIASDMSYSQLEEILKMVFDPARGQWLAKHQPLLEAFDKIGRSFRLGIMQICEQESDRVASFLHDYEFIPQLSKHVDAARTIMSKARAGNLGGSNEEQSFYVPFYKCAERVVQHEKAREEAALRDSSISLLDTPSDMHAIKQPALTVEDNRLDGLELVRLLTKNARAMLSQSSMIPQGISRTHQGIYVKA